VKSPAAAVSNELSLSASPLASIPRHTVGLNRWTEGLLSPEIGYGPKRLSHTPTIMLRWLDAIPAKFRDLCLPGWRPWPLAGA
jgi:hypothetical protein